MISGSYSGGISFFKGDGKGGFLAETKLQRADGKPLSEASAQSPCLGDWDGDGDLDVVLGEIAGPISLFLNQGGMKFAPSVKLTLDGQDWQVSDGGPCIVDWNGDGILDLLMGDDEGNVMFHAGKTKGGTDLAAGLPLLPAWKPGEGWQPIKRDAKSPTGFGAKRPGVRTKPFAADWNADGKLDLLVGDFAQVQGPEPKLTPAQVQQRDRLRKRSKEIGEAMTPLHEKFRAHATEVTGIEQPKTDEEHQRWSEAYVAAMSQDEAWQKLNQEMTKVRRELHPLEPLIESTGFVWVYLRR